MLSSSSDLHLHDVQPEVVLRAGISLLASHLLPDPANGSGTDDELLLSTLTTFPKRPNGCDAMLHAPWFKRMLSARTSDGTRTDILTVPASDVSYAQGDVKYLNLVQLLTLRVSNHVETQSDFYSAHRNFLAIVEERLLVVLGEWLAAEVMANDRGGGVGVGVEDEDVVDSVTVEAKMLKRPSGSSDGSACSLPGEGLAFGLERDEKKDGTKTTTAGDSSSGAEGSADESEADAAVEERNADEVLENGVLSKEGPAPLRDSLALPHPAEAENNGQPRTHGRTSSTSSSLLSRNRMPPAQKNSICSFVSEFQGRSLIKGSEAFERSSHYRVLGLKAVMYSGCCAVLENEKRDAVDVLHRTVPHWFCFEIPPEEDVVFEKKGSRFSFAVFSPNKKKRSLEMALEQGSPEGENSDCSGRGTSHFRFGRESTSALPLPGGSASSLRLTEYNGDHETGRESCFARESCTSTASLVVTDEEDSETVEHLPQQGFFFYDARRCSGFWKPPTATTPVAVVREQNVAQGLRMLRWDVVIFSNRELESKPKTQNTWGEQLALNAKSLRYGKRLQLQFQNELVARMSTICGEKRREEEVFDNSKYDRVRGDQVAGVVHLSGAGNLAALLAKEQNGVLTPRDRSDSSVAGRAVAVTLAGEQEREQPPAPDGATTQDNFHDCPSPTAAESSDERQERRSRELKSSASFEEMVLTGPLRKSHEEGKLSPAGAISPENISARLSGARPSGTDPSSGRLSATGRSSSSSSGPACGLAIGREEDGVARESLDDSAGGVHAKGTVPSGATRQSASADPFEYSGRKSKSRLSQLFSQVRSSLRRSGTDSTPTASPTATETPTATGPALDPAAADPDMPYESCRDEESPKKGNPFLKKPPAGTTTAAATAPQRKNVFQPSSRSFRRIPSRGPSSSRLVGAGRRTTGMLPPRPVSPTFGTAGLQNARPPLPAARATSTGIGHGSHCRDEVVERDEDDERELERRRELRALLKPPGATGTAALFGSERGAPGSWGRNEGVAAGVGGTRGKCSKSRSRSAVRKAVKSIVSTAQVRTVESKRQTVSAKNKLALRYLRSIGCAE